jgi:hypothetical protein
VSEVILQTDQALTTKEKEKEGEKEMEAVQEKQSFTNLKLMCPVPLEITELEQEWQRRLI